MERDTGIRFLVRPAHNAVQSTSLYRLVSCDADELVVIGPSVRVETWNTRVPNHASLVVEHDECFW